MANEVSALSEASEFVEEAKSKGKAMYFIYMIKNKNNELYIGVTENPNSRLAMHNSKRGAQFTKTKSVFEIVFLERYNTLSEARQREIQLKKWRREKKEFLIERYSKKLDTKQK